MTEWRKQLERNITKRMLAEHEERAAPPEVIHRRVNGREVLNRRLAFNRTSRNDTHLETWSERKARYE